MHGEAELYREVNEDGLTTFSPVAEFISLKPEPSKKEEQKPIEEQEEKVDDDTDMIE